MDKKTKTIRFIILFIITLCMFAIALFQKNSIETNTLKSLLPPSVINVTELFPITNKSNTIIKVVFESDSKDKTEALKQNFISKVDKTYYNIKIPNFPKLMKQYKTHPTNFLSYHTRAMLSAEDYETVFQNSMEALYNSNNLKLVPIDRDPCILFEDFVISNRKLSQEINNINGKYYDTLILMSKENSNISTSKNQAGKLINLKKSLSENDSRIYISGNAVNAYYSSRNTIIGFLITGGLTLLLISILTFVYFKKLNVLLPIALSITIGILSGFSGTKLWFHNVQRFTIIFSIIPIGIAINLSMYYLFGLNKQKNFVKNLGIYFISVIIPLGFLYSTQINLLQQMSVFILFGLISICLMILYIYPCFELYKPTRNFNFNTENNFKIHKYLFVILCVLSLCGLTRLCFDDSLSVLYKPIGRLTKSEKLYNKISGDNYQKAQYITVKGENLQDILKKEEKITDELSEDNIEYLSLSKFIPSTERQKENFKLVKNMYKKTLFKYSNLLSFDQIKRLKGEGFTPVIFNIDEYPVLSDFMLDKNTSVIMVFSNQKIVVSDKSAIVVNIKSDITKYLTRYRVLLLELLPVAGLLLFAVLAIIKGKTSGIKILAPSVYGMLGGVCMSGLISGELNLFSILTLFIILILSIDASIFRCDYRQCSSNPIFFGTIITSFIFLMLSFSEITLLDSISRILFFGILISYLSGFIMFSDKNNDTVSE